MALLREPRREHRLGRAQNVVDAREEQVPRRLLMLGLGPHAHLFRRRQEQLVHAHAALVARERLQRSQHEQRDHHRARPIGHLRHVEGKPARQVHDLDRHHRRRAPWDDAVKRELDAREHVAHLGAAARQDRFAGARHVRRVDAVADHLQREIGFHAGAHVELALMEQGPAAMLALDAAQIFADLPLALDVRLLAEVVREQDIFGGDRGVGLELEAPMAILSADGSRAPPQPPRCEPPTGRRLSRFSAPARQNRTAPPSNSPSPRRARSLIAIMVHYPLIASHAALSPERIAPSMVAGRPVCTQSPARKRLRHFVFVSGRNKSCSGLAANVARFSLTICQGGKSRAKAPSRRRHRATIRRQVPRAGDR